MTDSTCLINDYRSTDETLIEGRTEPKSRETRERI